MCRDFDFRTWNMRRIGRPCCCLRPMNRAFAGDLAAFLLMHTAVFSSRCCWHTTCVCWCNCCGMFLLFLASHASWGLSCYWPAVIGRPCCCWSHFCCWSPYCRWCPWCLSARMYSGHHWVLQYCASSYPLAFERFHIHTSPQVLEEGSEVQCLKTFCPVFFTKQLLQISLRWRFFG